MANKFNTFGKISLIAGISLMLAATATGAMAASAPSNQWKFDEATAGAAAQDSIGGINGNANGSPSPQPSSDVAYTSPANSGSMQFDGQNYYEIANTLSADFTICAWIKTLSTGGDQHWVGANIIEAETGGFALDYGFGINNEGKLMFGNGGVLNGGDADANTMGNTVVADNAWHEVCVTRNNTTGENILFVDGNQDASGFTGVGLVNTNPLARIASGTDGAAPFVGLIDDLRLYQSVVPAEEIAARFAVDEVIYQNNVSLANTGRDVSILFASAGALILLGAGSMVFARIRKN
jgi:LPXTG-motif cell wall-anchored protein